MISILLVEDDVELAGLLIDHLHKYEMVHVANAQDVLTTLEENQSFSLIILDLTLPDIDGLKLCKLIRQKVAIDIIISSARNTIEDKLEGLSQKCANDYIVKPYDPRELEARIVQIISRYKNMDKDSLFRVDVKASKVYKRENYIDFTKAEYEIFKLLFMNQNRYFSRLDIANTISTHSYDSMLESISMLLSKIRKKIDSDAKESYIQNKRNIGYFFNEA